MQTPELTEKLRTQSALLERYSVSSLAVFGSVARGDAGPDSDIDMLVTFKPDAAIGIFKFLELRDALSGLLGHPVDLAVRDSLHPALAARIVAEAVDVA